MKTNLSKTDGLPLRWAGTGLIALLGREDGRTVAAVRRRLGRLRRPENDPFAKSHGPRHD
jgi:hypothetical protein